MGCGSAADLGRDIQNKTTMTSITDAAVIENQKARLDLLKRMDRRVRELETALQQLKEILAVPASNRQMMQIAGPARRCLNIIKSTETLNYAEEVERLWEELNNN
jgi:phosphopantetheine adenylyltransferase